MKKLTALTAWMSHQAKLRQTKDTLTVDTEDPTWTTTVDAMNQYTPTGEHPFITHANVADATICTSFIPGWRPETMDSSLELKKLLLDRSLKYRIQAIAAWISFHFHNVH